MPNISLEDAAGWFGDLPSRIAHAAQEGLVQAGLRGVQIIVTRIIPSRSPKPMDRGVYRAGWRIDRRGFGDSARVFIENLEPHAAFIEFGVRPGNVKIGAAMIRALTEWCLRKGIANSEAEATGIAWAIARSMQKRGIFKGTSGGLGVLKEFMKDYANTVIAEEVSRAVNRELGRG